jgi:hypothetical protein
MDGVSDISSQILNKAINKKSSITNKKFYRWIKLKLHL